MGLVATMTYVKGLLDGLAIPGNTGPLTCFIVPPDPEENRNGTPRASVWSSDGNVERLSGPRQLPGDPSTAGWKDQWHNLGIYLWYPMADEEPDEDSAFPGVIDTVVYTLGTSQNPAIITDPRTGIETQLVDLGENLQWQLPPVHALAVQRWERYDCLITARTLEQIRS